MNISIIIPLYNEEKLIIELLQELEKVSYPSFVNNIDIIIVDDASSDNSFANVQNWINGKNNIQLLKHDKNKGKGAAVKTGVAIATGDYVLIQDADMELSPKDIPVMIEAANNLNIPFVNGSRYLPGVIRTQAAFKRYFANKLFTLITSMLINVT